MTTISLVANDQLLSVALKPKLASGNQNSVTLHVEFSSEWDGYARSGVFFTSNDETPYEKIMTNDECTIPAEVLAEAGVLFIGVRGVNASNNAVKTSSLVKYKISEGALEGKGTEVEPTANVYQQLLSAINVERARIDNLTRAEESGMSTDAERELADVRVGANGTVYDNAGEAVRGQVSQLSSENAELKNELSKISTESYNLYNSNASIDNMSLASGTGKTSSNDSYWITDFIPITGDSLKISLNGKSQDSYKVCFYSADNEDSFIRTDATIGSLHTIQNGENYARVQFKKSWLDIVNEELVISLGTENKPYKPYGIREIIIVDKSITIDKLTEELQYALSEKTYAYYGEKINLNNGVDIKRAYEWTANTPDGAPNSCVIYDNMMFLLGSSSGCRVFDISTEPWTTITDFYLDTEKAPHCNASFWGKKYDETDPYPILYVNAYNNPNLPRATLYGYRISVDDNGAYSSTLVQTITVGFAYETVWSDGNDVRPYGNFFLDTTNNILYAYTLKDSDKVTRFFAFNMPNISNSEVILQQGDILSQFDTEYMPIIQDNFYHNGCIYINTGLPNAGTLNVVNLLSKQKVSQVNYPELGITIEPEAVAIYNGKMLTGNGLMYWLTF